jgi:hypothetical protein
LDLLPVEPSHTGGTRTKESGKVSGRERERTDLRGTEAVLVERSTEDRGEKTAVE